MMRHSLAFEDDIPTFTGGAVGGDLPDTFYDADKHRPSVGAGADSLLKGGSSSVPNIHSLLNDDVDSVWP